jgi:hypothetical protein
MLVFGNVVEPKLFFSDPVLDPNPDLDPDYIFNSFTNKKIVKILFFNFRSSIVAQKVVV